MIDLERKFCLKHISSISIKTKLLFFSLAISIIPLFVITYLNYIVISEKTTQDVTYSANQVFDQNRQLLENKINTIWSISVSVASEREIVQYNLSEHSMEYYNNYIIQNSDYLKFSSYMTSIQKYPEVSRAIIYASERNMFANENTNFFNIDKVLETDWYQRLIRNNYLLLWLPYSKDIVTQQGAPVVTALKKINNLSNYSELLGVLRIDMPLSHIEQIVNNNIITPNSHSFILNSSNDVIYSHANILSWIGIDLTFDMFEDKYKSPTLWYNVDLRQESYILKCIAIDYTDWVMVLMIPKSDLLALSNRTRDDMLLVALITSIIVSALAYLFSSTLTRRIRSLANHMYAIDSNINNAILKVDSHDEFGILQQSFNVMLNRIQSLIKEERRLGQEVKNLELKALQAQINPHFLYNTLDLIYWRAMNKDVPEISHIIQALAKFYKLGLSKGEDTVFLKDDIQHVCMYIKIQNERFNDIIDFKSDIEENVMECKVLKLLLQPIVENAIMHGIMKKESIKGYIYIKAYKDNDTLKISITDNGNGMSDEQIRRLFDDSGNNEHYGIKNIYERIQLKYGPEYGLQYTSIVGEGTTVVISLPIVF